MKLIFEIVAAVIVSVGGAGFIILKLADWLGRVWANKILEQDKAKYNRELEDIKNKFTKELEYYKSQVEFTKIALSRYSDHQFKLYNKLWISLVELKISGDQLWDNVDENSVLDFSFKVRQAQEELLKNALLIEGEHEKKLTELLNKFANYSFGKYKLAQLNKDGNARSLLSSLLLSGAHKGEIVRDNMNAKGDYDNLLVLIKESFKNQIKEGL